MGKVFGAIAGKPAKASSENRAYGDISSAFGPLFGLAQTGADGLSKLLGGDSSGFDSYKDATGFDFAAEQGSRGITGNAAARGLLRGGGVGKALVNYGNNIEDQYAQSYMDRLLGQAGIGLQAGGLVAQAGQTSQSKGPKKGIGKFLGQAAAGVAASDRRLKKNVFEVGSLPNGLKMYQYRYLDGSGPFIGVMADEVALEQPEALGPVVDGYQTVDYGRLNTQETLNGF